MNERTKKIAMIILFAAGSAFFLYNGFSLLFEEQRHATPQEQHSADN